MSVCEECNVMNKIIIIASLVTCIAAIGIILLAVFGDFSSDWPIAAAMGCVVVGCVITLFRMRKS